MEKRVFLSRMPDAKSLQNKVTSTGGKAAVRQATHSAPSSVPSSRCCLSVCESSSTSLEEQQIQGVTNYYLLQELQLHSPNANPALPAQVWQMGQLLSSHPPQAGQWWFSTASIFLWSPTSVLNLHRNESHLCCRQI